MSGYQLTVMHKSTKWRQDPFKHMKLQASCTAVNFLLWSLMGYLRTFWWSDRVRQINKIFIYLAIKYRYNWNTRRRMVWISYLTLQALYWQAPGYKRGPGRPRANWRGVVNKDLWKMGFTWEEAEVTVLDRHGWRRSVAQCVQLDAGWIKVKVKYEIQTFSWIINCDGKISLHPYPGIIWNVFTVV